MESLLTLTNLNLPPLEACGTERAVSGRGLGGNRATHRGGLAAVLNDYTRAVTNGAHTRLPEITLLDPGLVRRALAGLTVRLRRSFSDTLRGQLRKAESSSRKLAMVHYHTVAGGHWLQCSVRPYRLGEGCDGARDRELKYLLGHFLNHATAHPDIYPGISRENLSDFWLEAYAWQTSNLPPAQAKAEKNSFRRAGRLIIEGCALEGIGAAPDELVEFDTAWPAPQDKKLLADAYDVNNP